MSEPPSHNYASCTNGANKQTIVPMSANRPTSPSVASGNGANGVSEKFGFSEKPVSFQQQPQTRRHSDDDAGSLYRKLLAAAVAIGLILAISVVVLAVFLGQEAQRSAELRQTLANEGGFHGAWSSDQKLPPHRASDSILGNYSRLAVAADNGECSAIGRHFLMRGGNAVDAAVAVDFCTGLFSMHSSGIGGGFFMTLYNRTTQTCSIIDAREEAPAAANSTMFVGLPKEASSAGWLSVGVPGEIYGLYLAHKNYGKLPWRDLLQPAINLARYGFTVSPALEQALESSISRILLDETLKSMFFNSEEGRILQAGERVRNTKLADTFERLANSANPIELFYQGAMAKEFAREFQSNGGIITLDDFKNYRAKQRQAVTLKLSDDLVVCGPPPPSGAAVTMAILNAINGYHLTHKNMETASDAAETYHRILETFKFAYAARSELGDAEFVPNAKELVENITSEEWAREVRSRITSKSHDTEYYGGQFEIARDHGTSHMSIVDAEGNAISLTTTINLHFGAKKTSPSTGIIWNDEMDDFSSPAITNYFGIPPSPANSIQPGKRPMSSMSPLIFYRPSGDVRLVIGGSGGANIISGTAYTALRNLWLNETVKEAIDSPRFHHQLRPEFAEYEGKLLPQVVANLLKEDKGQTLISVSTAGSRIMAVERRPDDRLFANSDYRKEGGFPSGD